MVRATIGCGWTRCVIPPFCTYPRSAAHSSPTPRSTVVLYVLRNKCASVFRSVVVISGHLRLGCGYGTVASVSRKMFEGVQARENLSLQSGAHTRHTTLEHS